jgi:hypothetical protein
MNSLSKVQHGAIAVAWFDEAIRMFDRRLNPQLPRIYCKKGGYGMDTRIKRSKDLEFGRSGDTIDLPLP